jgi:hypothetical protein
MADPAVIPAPRPGRFLSSQVRGLLATLAIAAVLARIIETERSNTMPRIVPAPR